MEAMGYENYIRVSNSAIHLYVTRQNQPVGQDIHDFALRFGFAYLKTVITNGWLWQIYVLEQDKVNV